MPLLITGNQYGFIIINPKIKGSEAGLVSNNCFLPAANRTISTRVRRNKDAMKTTAGIIIIHSQQVFECSPKNPFATPLTIVGYFKAFL